MSVKFIIIQNSLTTSKLITVDTENINLTVETINKKN